MTEAPKLVAKYILSMALGFGIVLTIPAATVWAVDPFKMRNVCSLFATYLSDSRMDAPGITRNATYDTIVVGSSTAMNFYEADIEKYLGGRALNLSLTNSNIFEQSRYVRQALSTGQVKRVIWQIFPPNLGVRANGAGPIDGLLNPMPVFDNRHIKTEIDGNRIRAIMQHDYLFESAPSRWMKYLFNYKNFSVSLSLLWDWLNDGEQTSPCPFDNNLRNKIKNSYSVEFIEKYFQNRSVGEPMKEQMPFQPLPPNSIRNMRTILDLAAAHPETEFIIVSGVRNLLNMELLTTIRANWIQHFSTVWERLLDESKGLNNVKLFDFQTFPDLNNNLSYFVDPYHMSREGSARILEYISQGKGIVDESRRGTIFPSLLSQVKEFHIMRSAAALNSRHAP